MKNRGKFSELNSEELRQLVGGMLEFVKDHGGGTQRGVIEDAVIDEGFGCVHFKLPAGELVIFVADATHFWREGDDVKIHFRVPFHGQGTIVLRQIDDQPSDPPKADPPKSAKYLDPGFISPDPASHEDIQLGLEREKGDREDPD